MTPGGKAAGWGSRGARCLLYGCSYTPGLFLYLKWSLTLQAGSELRPFSLECHTGGGEAWIYHRVAGFHQRAGSMTSDRCRERLGGRARSFQRLRQAKGETQAPPK